MSKKSSFTKYNVAAQAATATFKIMMVVPGVGETEDYVLVRSTYSKEYREAELKASRQIRSLTLANAGKVISDELADDITMTVFCSLVTGWSFEEDADLDNVKTFLEANPQMYDIINTQCAMHSNFFK